MATLLETEIHCTGQDQNEHNGSWCREIGNSPKDGLYLYLGGSNEGRNHWWKNLQPGEAFETVPVAISIVKDRFEEAVSVLTAYRRSACLRPHADNRLLSVIFNDFTHCLFADPSTESAVPISIQF